MKIHTGDNPDLLVASQSPNKEKFHIKGAPEARKRWMQAWVQQAGPHLEKGSNHCATQPQQPKRVCDPWSTTFKVEK